MFWIGVAVACGHPPFCKYTNHGDNPTRLVNQGAGTACNATFSEQRSQSQTAVYSNAAPGPIIHSAPRVDREVQLVNGFQLRRRALSKTTVLTVACVKYGICGCSDAGCWY